jgi:hypothetical protein
MSKSTMYQQIEGKKRRTQDKEKTEEWFEGKRQPGKEEAERREKKYGELIEQDL